MVVTWNPVYMKYGFSSVLDYACALLTFHIISHEMEMISYLFALEFHNNLHLTPCNKCSVMNDTFVLSLVLWLVILVVTLYFEITII